MRSGVVDGGDKGVVLIAIDEEGIILGLCVIHAEYYAAELSFDDVHLDLEGQVVKVGGLSSAKHKGVLLFCDGMIDSPTEHTAGHPVRGGVVGPVVGAVRA